MEDAVARNYGKVFDEGLRNKQPIERIAMMARQIIGGDYVPKFNLQESDLGFRQGTLQRFGTVRQHMRVARQLAFARFDSEFPKARNAYIEPVFRLGKFLGRTAAELLRLFFRPDEDV